MICYVIYTVFKINLDEAQFCSSKNWRVFISMLRLFNFILN